MKKSIGVSPNIETLFGTRDENVRLLEDGLNITINLRANSIELEGAARDVGRGPGDDAFVVIQSDRQSREGRGRVQIIRTMVVLVRMRSLPGRNAGAICGTGDVMGKAVPEFRSFLLLSDQYRIDDNWHVAGLKGTGSKDIVVENAFVPDYRSQSHIDYGMNLPLAGQKLNDGPLYRLPWSVVFHMALAASVLGIAHGFVYSWIEQTRNRTLSFGGRAADDALTQQRLAEALWYVDVTETRMRTDALELWQMAEAREPVPMQLRAQVRWRINRGSELVAQAISDLFRVASGRAVFLDHPLQQRFQDLQAAMAHAYMGPDPLARAVGGFLLGSSKREIVL